jgi:hypothetical protein
MSQKIRFFGTRYARLVFSGLFITILGIAFTGIGILLGSTLPLLFSLLLVFGLVFLGLGAIGAAVAVFAVIQAARCYLALDDEKVGFFTGKKKLWEIRFADINVLTADYERLVPAKAGIKPQSNEASGLRLVGRHETGLLNRSMLKKGEVDKINTLLAARAHHSIDRPQLGPEIVRARLVSESYSFEPEPGLVLLTDRHLLVYGKEKQVALPFRTGKTIVVLKLPKLAKHDIFGEKLVLHTADGLEYEVIFAHQGEGSGLLNRNLAEKWASALSLSK